MVRKAPIVRTATALVSVLLAAGINALMIVQYSPCTGSELTDASTSSFDTSSHSQSSADLAEDTSSASSEAAEEVDSSRRLQDLSEDDFDTNEEPEVDITEQYQ